MWFRLVMGVGVMSNMFWLVGAVQKLVPYVSRVVGMGKWGMLVGLVWPVIVWGGFVVVDVVYWVWSEKQGVEWPRRRRLVMGMGLVLAPYVLVRVIEVLVLVNFVGGMGK